MFSSLHSYGKHLGPPPAMPIFEDSFLAAMPDGAVLYVNLRDVNGRCHPGHPSAIRQNVVNATAWYHLKPYARVKITIKKRKDPNA